MGTTEIKCGCFSEFQNLAGQVKLKHKTNVETESITKFLLQFATIPIKHDCDLYDDISMDIADAIETGRIKSILIACIIGNVLKDNLTFNDPFLPQKMQSLKHELHNVSDAELMNILNRQETSKNNVYSKMLRKFRHLFNFLIFLKADPTLINQEIKATNDEIWHIVKSTWLQHQLKRFNCDKEAAVDALMADSDTAKHFLNADSNTLQRFLQSLPKSTDVARIQEFFEDFAESRIPLVKLNLLLIDTKHSSLAEKQLYLNIEICTYYFSKFLSKSNSTNRLIDETKPYFRHLLKYCSWTVAELKTLILLVQKNDDAIPMKDSLQIIVEFEATFEDCSFNLGNVDSGKWPKIVHQTLIDRYFSQVTHELTFEEIIDKVFIKDEKGEIDISKQQFTEIYENVITASSAISHNNMDQMKALITENEIPGNWCTRLAYIIHIANLHFKVSFRTVQICAIILAHYKPSHRSRVLQINTGEGKTYIIAILAVLKALDHFKVDIITSSTELAELQSEKLAPFYGIFKLTTANNKNPWKNAGPINDFLTLIGCGQPRPYECDIVYGEVSDFQGDILRDEFQKNGVKCNRPCEYAIVDEVDSMMIDRSLNFVYLSEKVPGMFHLLHILGAIWTQIQHISKTIVHRNGKWYYNDPGVQQTLMQDSEDYIIEQPIWNFYKQCTTDYIEKLLRIKSPEEKDFPKLQYPQFLKAFVKVQLPRWIASAISAKLHMRLGYEYVLHDGKITVVDADRTGVLEFSMTWSNGLHQFLQMKHGCQITPENLTTNYISNVTYLQRYGTNLIGLTGTIGGDSDRKLLRKAYSTDCVVLPPYREPRHIQLSPITGINRRDWLQKVVSNVSKKLDYGQAGLVVTNYIKEAEDIAEMLKIKHGSKILKYTKNSESSVTQKILEPGECIIATNIAGRGTDVLVTKEVEAAGGLHVCVTFLPENCRVERQNIGRTSRTGNRGTSQFIVLQENSIEEAGIALQRLRETRDIYVMACVEKSLKEIETAHQKDRTFKRFCMLKDSIERSVNPEINEYIQEALNEKFGHWLLENEKNLSTSAFENFERHCLNSPEETIIENSFIFVKMAQDFIKNKSFHQAHEYLTNAIALDSELAANAYYLRGYVKIVLYNQNSKKRSLITGAIEDLSKARKIIEDEHQVNINLICSEHSGDDTVQIMEQLSRYKTLFGTIINSINAAIGQEIQGEIDELEDALDNNKELDSEQRGNLQNRRNYLVDNRNDLENGALLAARRNGRAVVIKKLDFEEALPPDERKELFEGAIKEINLNGFYNVFIFNEKTPINWGSVIGIGLLGLGQLAAGAATVFFSVGVGIGVGYALIQEGVCDLIAAVKDGIINRNFSWARWGIQKAISLAITVACAGFAALKSAASGAVRGMKVAANAAKEGIKTTAKAAFKSCAKLIGMEVAKGATKEIIAPFIGYAISNTVEEPLKAMVNSAVNNTVASYLSHDSNVAILIECDRKNRNYKYAKKLEEKLLWFLNKDPDVYRQFGRDIMRRLEGRVDGLTGQVINLVSQGAKYHEILTLINEVMQHLPNYVADIANSEECQADYKKEEPPQDDSIVRVSAINVTLEDFCQHISNSVSTMIVSFAMGAFVQKISSSCVNSAFKSISNHVNQEIEEFRKNYGGVHGDFEELDTKMDSRLRMHALKLEENIAAIESGGPASAVHVESLARSIGQQIVVVDGSETIVFGEATPGTEPIVLNYEPGEDGGVGHYTLANGKVVAQTGQNSCLFDAVAAETGIPADELRKETATLMVHNFRKFAEVERMNDDIAILGGASKSSSRHTYTPDTINVYSDGEDWSESCERNGLDHFEQNVENSRPKYKNKVTFKASKGQPRTTLYIDPVVFDGNMQKEYDRVFDNLLKAGQVQESQRSTYSMNIQIKGKVKGCQRIAIGGQLSAQQWVFIENPVFVVKGGQALHYEHTHQNTITHTRIPTKDNGPPTRYKHNQFQYEKVP